MKNVNFLISLKHFSLPLNNLRIANDLLPGSREMSEQLFDYLYQSNPLPCYLSPAASQPQRESDEFTRDIRRTRVRCWSFARLGIIIPPRIYPGRMYRAARDAGLPTLRASEDNVGRSTTRSLLSYLNVSPSPTRNLCSIYQGFMRWLLRTVTGLSKGLRRLYITQCHHKMLEERL